MSSQHHLFLFDLKARWFFKRMYSHPSFRGDGEANPCFREKIFQCKSLHMMKCGPANLDDIFSHLVNFKFSLRLLYQQIYAARQN